MPLHSSLGNQSKTPPQKKKEEEINKNKNNLKKEKHCLLVSPLWEIMTFDTFPVEKPTGLLAAAIVR